MISVLYIIGSLDVGGAEKHLVRLLPLLKKSNLHVSVYTLTHKGELARVLESAGIEVFQPPLADFFYKNARALKIPFLLPLTVLNLWVLMLIRRPVIVHSFLPAAYLLGGICFLLSGSKFFVMSRRSLNEYQTKHPLLSRIEYFLHRKINLALGNSSLVIEQLKQEGVPPSKLKLIYNGIDASKKYIDVESLIENKKRARNLLDIDDSCFVIVMVANIISYKGHEDLIRAIYEVKDRIQKENLVLFVGKDGGLLESLINLSNELNLSSNIRWLGLLHNVDDVLYASDVGVLCSHQEGFSNSILEYMSASLPVIATDVGGNSEAVKHKETGYIVESKNTKMLGDAIVELANSKEMRLLMGIRANKRVHNLFSINKCADEYLQTYLKLFNEENNLSGN